jgi:protease YdgD
MAPNVYPDNARSAVTQLQAPSRWIGKLVLPGGGWCTAGLVQKDLILTAAHCVMDDGAHILVQGDYHFYYGYIGGKWSDQSTVSWIWWGTTDPQNNRGSDWAFLRLNDALGAEYGWMGVRSLDLSTLVNQNVVGMTSYGSDFLGGETPSYEMGCAFTGSQSNGTELHDCDMSRGASGAPMYRPETDASGNTSYYVLAINVADFRDGKDQSLLGIPYTPQHANVAVPAQAFLSTLQSIIAQDSGKQP